MTNPQVNSRYFFRVSDRDAAGAVSIGVSGDYPAAAYADLATAQACNNCHGDAGIAPHTTYPYDYPAMKVSECVVCHESNAYAFIPNFPHFETIIHGIHNSHQMPTGSYDFNATTKFEVTYPTYMSNCSVCHDSPTTLTAANAMPVTGPYCFSCHESMDSWDFTESGATFHEAYTEKTDCQECHKVNGVAASLVNVTQFHNSLETERVGIIWNGEDLSVTEGKKFTWKIDNVVDDGTNLKISWSATYNGAAVDPCNTTIGAGKPLFHLAPTGTVLDGAPQFLRTYAQGDDFILGKSTSAPGQPGTLTLSATNTACAGERGDHDVGSRQGRAGGNAGLPGPPGQAAAAAAGGLRQDGLGLRVHQHVCPRPDPGPRVRRGYGRQAGHGASRNRRYRRVPEVPCRLALSARQHPRRQREDVRRLPQLGVE